MAHLATDRWESTPATKRLATLLLVPGCVIQHHHAPTQDAGDVPAWVVASMGGFVPSHQAQGRRALARVGLTWYSAPDGEWVFATRDVAPDMVEAGVVLHYTAMPPGTRPTWDGLRAGIAEALHQATGRGYNYLGEVEQVEVATRALVALYTGAPLVDLLAGWVKEHPPLEWGTRDTAKDPTDEPAPTIDPNTPLDLAEHQERLHATAWATLVHLMDGALYQVCRLEYRDLPAREQGQVSRLALHALVWGDDLVESVRGWWAEEHDTQPPPPASTQPPGHQEPEPPAGKSIEH